MEEVSHPGSALFDSFVATHGFCQTVFDISTAINGICLHWRPAAISARSASSHASPALRNK